MASFALKLADGQRIPLLRAIPFALVHLTCLAVFFVEFHWTWVVLCLVLYAVRMFFVTAGYHRYFSHRSYKTSRLFQFFLAFMAMTSAQKGVLWWASHHRVHHRYSDTEDDVHSPMQFGFWWSHVGWIMSDAYEHTESDLVRDFSKYPELRFLDRFHLIPPTILGLTLFLIGGWSALVWSFFVSTVLLWHGSFTINSLAHLFGRRRYETTDTSRNNWWLALLTLGEGWHNNHHHYMASVRQGFFWWEVDVTYYVLKVLSWFRIVWDLRLPPPHVLYPSEAAS